MTEAERVAELKTFWETLPPKWGYFAAAVLRAPDDVVFLTAAWERISATNRGLEDAVHQLRNENVRLRLALKRWADEEPLAEPPALEAVIEEAE